MGWTYLKRLSYSDCRAEGVIITHGQGSRSSTVSRFERILPALLLSIGGHGDRLRASETTWCIPYTEFVSLKQGNRRIRESMQMVAIYTGIGVNTFVGAPDFRYQYRFFHGRSPVPLRATRLLRCAA